MMRHSLPLILGAGLLLCSAGCAPVNDGLINETARLLEDQSVLVGDLTRYYNVYLPSRLPAGAPLLILLHGGGGNKDDLLDEPSPTAEWKLIADEEKLVLIIPNGTDRFGNPRGSDARWNDCRNDAPPPPGPDDVAFISRLIDRLITDYNPDPSRVYVTGSSNGGMMSFRLALELPDKVAAIAVFIAGLPARSECLARQTPISVFICNGTADPLMPWEGGQIARDIEFLDDRGEVLSAPETLNFWKTYNDAWNLLEETSFPDIRPGDQSTVHRVTFRNTETGTGVAFYTVNGGGHAMPSKVHHLDLSSTLMQQLIGFQNRDIEGAREAWEFLKAYSR